MPKNPENPWDDMPPAFNPDGEDWVDLGLGGFLDDPAEYGKMKVPTLRNIGMRPYEGFVQAYSHNGFFKSLRDIVDFSNTRDVADWPPPEYPENVNDEELGDLGLSDQDGDADRDPATASGRRGGGGPRPERPPRPPSRR